MDHRSPLQQAMQGALRAEPTSPGRFSTSRAISKVVLGDLLFDTWYASCYPEELIQDRRRKKEKLERLYVCRSCFRYSKDLSPYGGHSRVCPFRNQSPPGRLVYLKDQYSIYEVDGDEHKLFCQNLSLFAKFFIENKCLCFDVSSFNFYILVYTDIQPQLASNSEEQRTSHQVIGFFSKEKISWDNNNVACILVFPPWQKKGLGKILMGASYELARRAGTMGGPEKPLSDLGRRAYISFWSASIARFILSSPPRKAITVKSISKATYILPEDVITALKEMDIIRPKELAKGRIVVRKSKVREWARSNRVGMASPVDPEAFVDGLNATGEANEKQDSNE